MLISCNKLKSHIKNSEDIDWLNIWDTFTLRTAEVEGVEQWQAHSFLPKDTLGNECGCYCRSHWKPF